MRPKNIKHPYLISPKKNCNKFTQTKHPLSFSDRGLLNNVFKLIQGSNKFKSSFVKIAYFILFILYHNTLKKSISNYLFIKSFINFIFSFGCSKYFLDLPIRCLIISDKNIAAVTETLKLCTIPFIGIYIFLSDN